jgi:hypothetical protein
MRSVLARLLPLLAAVVVLLTLAAPDREHYFCRMMGQVLPECCCAEAHAAPAVSAVTVRPVGCCERIAPSKHTGVASVKDHAVSVSPAALLAVLPSFTHAAPGARVGVTLPALARAPPSIGPPLFIAHCALLS